MQRKNKMSNSDKALNSMTQARLHVGEVYGNDKEIRVFIS